jgi:hypothetical protein
MEILVVKASHGNGAQLNSLKQINPFYPRPLIFRICMIPLQQAAFRYQR